MIMFVNQCSLLFVIICIINVYTFHHERVPSSSSLKNSHGNIAMLVPNPESNGRNKRIISPNEINTLFNSNNRIKPTNYRDDDEDDEDDLEVDNDEDEGDDEEPEVLKPSTSRTNIGKYDISMESMTEASAIDKMKRLEHMAITGQIESVPNVETVKEEPSTPSSTYIASTSDDSGEYGFTDLDRALDTVSMSIYSGL